MPEDSPIVIALDFPDARSSNSFLDYIDGRQHKLKVGLELFISEGPGFVKQLVDRGHQVFLDLKLHDIPNTVASACKAASDLGVWMISLHASGGAEMLQAAHDSIFESAHPTKLVAVTVLTSMDQRQLHSTGIRRSAQAQVSQLADIALQAGLHGIVCSAHEVRAVREKWGEQLTAVTPGIRLQHCSKDDQSRVASPWQARQSGADYIVIGRPITHAENPRFAIDQHLANWDSGAV